MQEKNPGEINSAATSEQSDSSPSPKADAPKKPFVEPQVSLPTDVLEATAFFQGSASLDVADS